MAIKMAIASRYDDNKTDKTNLQAGTGWSFLYDPWHAIGVWTYNWTWV